MDGVGDLLDFNRTHPQLSDFYYVVSPVVVPFGGPSNTRLVYDDEADLEIQVGVRDGESKHFWSNHIFVISNDSLKKLVDFFSKTVYHNYFARCWVCLGLPS